MFFQFSLSPRFELISHLLAFISNCSNHDVAVVRTAVYGMKVPRTNSAVFCYDRVYDHALLIIQVNCLFSHLLATPVSEKWLGNLLSFVPFGPASLITR